MLNKETITTGKALFFTLILGGALTLVPGSPAAANVLTSSTSTALLSVDAVVRTEPIEVDPDGFNIVVRTEPIEVDPDGLKTEPIEVDPDGLKTEPIEVDPDGLNTL